MAEYIEREAFLGKARKLPSVGGCAAVCREDLEDLIGTFPAADVAPVVHGHWVGLEYDGYADGFPVYDLWECSECGNEERGEDVPETHPFCNWCGARMDGDD